MKKLFTLILFLTLNSFSQNCVNADFEEGSLTNPTTPSTIVVTTINAVNGWTINGGVNSGGVNSCNLNLCCPSNPSNVKLMSTSPTIGYIDPNIGPTYPIFSVYGPFSNPNSNPYSLSHGSWFCKLNDDVGNNAIQRIRSTDYFNQPFYRFKYVAILPVMHGVNHSCCTAPVMKIVLKDAFGNPISVPNFSITPTTACSTPFTWSVCPGNSNYVFSPWKIILLPPSTTTISVTEITVADCGDGLHSAYAYVDYECETFFWYPVSTGPPSPNNVPITICGSTCTPLSGPPGLSSYLWSGPDVNVNGATTQSVNACVSGAYTLTVNAPTFINPVPMTFTLNFVPSPTVSLTSSQSTACVGGNTISLTGSPSGGSYTGSFVTGNTFNPSSVGNYSVSYTYTDTNGCSDTASSNINIITCATGINNLASSHFNADLYPQPTKDVVNINLINSFNKNIEVKIFDITGKEIEKKELEVSQSKTQFSTLHLSNGIYILQLKNSQGQVAVKRLVVSR
ncbi:MAG: T9SS type A sorting domain-containing protein [Bacteroidia bacterium]|nr:T9SS type A sorting domain-containing protein [Bacteroidia bacterium]